MDDINTEYWFKRGYDDGRKGTRPLFRNTVANGVHAVQDTPDDWTLEMEREAGRAYLRGYSAGER